MLFSFLKNWGVPQIATAPTTQNVEPNQLDAIARNNMIAALALKTGLNEEFSKM